MAGLSPYEAVHNYITPLQRVASCVTSAVLQYQGQYRSNTSYALTLGDGKPIRLKRVDVAAAALYLSVTMWYRSVYSNLPWPVVTSCLRHYKYSLDDDRQREIIAYHWHPGHGWAMFPHLHIEAGCDVGRKELIGIHLPTERIAFEDVVWIAIHELGVQPLRADWKDILDNARTQFNRYRTWPRPNEIRDMD